MDVSQIITSGEGFALAGLSFLLIWMMYKQVSGAQVGILTLQGAASVWCYNSEYICL